MVAIGAVSKEQDVLDTDIIEGCVLARAANGGRTIVRMHRSPKPKRGSAKPRPGVPAIPVLLVATMLASSGCSLRTMAVNAIVPVLADPAVYLSEEDPELVRESLPFLLKTIESIILTAPEQDEALVSACSGFTLYGNAFLQVDADIASWDGEYDREIDLRDRTWRLYVRARDYCLRSLELKYEGFGDDVREDPAAALAVTEVEDVEVLFLLSAAWGLAISNALDQPELIADLPGGAGAPRTGPRARRGTTDRVLSMEPSSPSSRCRLSSAARPSGPVSISSGRSSCRTGSTPRRT